MSHGHPHRHEGHSHEHERAHQRGAHGAGKGLRRLGISPLFAHPERCAEFEREGRAEEVVRLGGALQLNVGALAGVYGKPARRLAERILSEGLYAVAATDLHRPDGVREWLDEAHAALEKRAVSGGLERLLGENPRRILAGEDLA